MKGAHTKLNFVTPRLCLGGKAGMASVVPNFRPQDRTTGVAASLLETFRAFLSANDMMVDAVYSNE